MKKIKKINEMPSLKSRVDDLTVAVKTAGTFITHILVRLSAVEKILKKANPMLTDEVFQTLIYKVEDESEGLEQGELTQLSDKVRLIATFYADDGSETASEPESLLLSCLGAGKVLLPELESQLFEMRAGTEREVSCPHPQEPGVTLRVKVKIVSIARKPEVVEELEVPSGNGEA